MIFGMISDSLGQRKRRMFYFMNLASHYGFFVLDDRDLIEINLFPPDRPEAFFISFCLIEKNSKVKYLFVIIQSAELRNVKKQLRLLSKSEVDRSDLSIIFNRPFIYPFVCPIRIVRLLTL